MKNKFNLSTFQLSTDDHSVCSDIVNTLDEVYDQRSVKENSHKKSRIPIVNKHTLNKYEPNNNISANHNSMKSDSMIKDSPNNSDTSINDDFIRLSQAQPFNVLSLYQERERNTTAKYLSHGDFTEADGHITKKIRRRQVHVQAVIDLHNMTQDEAHRALNNFITSSAKNKYKVVRVITGKGKGGVGVIRKNIEEWINMHPIRPLVLGFDYAHKSDGGIGALNVLLRR